MSDSMITAVFSKFKTQDVLKKGIKMAFKLIGDILFVLYAGKLLISAPNPTIRKRHRVAVCF